MKRSLLLKHYILRSRMHQLNNFIVIVKVLLCLCVFICFVIFRYVQQNLKFILVKVLVRTLIELFPVYDISGSN